MRKAVSVIDNETFIDRFGQSLYVSELSTGCKAVILALIKPNKLINFIEAGLNARDYAIENLKSGKVLIEYPYTTFTGKNTIDCYLPQFGYAFSTIDRLNYFYKMSLGTSQTQV